MKIAVLGLGKVGHTLAALLCSRGFEVVGFTRDGQKALDVNRHGITVSGALKGVFPVTATTDIGQAVRGAKILLVTTTSAGHKPMAGLLSGRLERGQRIIISTGNWGAYEMYSLLKDEVEEKDVVIGETCGNLAACPGVTAPATAVMKPIKKRMAFATIPAAAASGVVEELKQAFPEYYPVENVLDTSMNCTNPPIHVPFCLFNITRMANGEGAQFYGECLPPILERFTLEADKERCAVVAALGGKPRTILQLLNEAWESDCVSLKELGLTNPSLKAVKLPATPYHRFLTEDVPYGLMPVSLLGKRCGVETPRIDLMIQAYRYLLGERAELDGPEFELDLARVL